jgi:hypothetical protein
MNADLGPQADPDPEHFSMPIVITLKEAVLKNQNENAFRIVIFPRYKISLIVLWSELF